MNIVTIILFGESSNGDVSADLSMVPLDEEEEEEEEAEEDDINEGELDGADEVVLEAGEFEFPTEEDAEVGVVEAELEVEVEEVGEPAEVAAGEVDDDDVEAVERADERDELLSDKADELNVRLAVSWATAWICWDAVTVGAAPETATILLLADFWFICCWFTRLAVEDCCGWRFDS